MKTFPKDEKCCSHNQLINNCFKKNQVLEKCHNTQHQNRVEFPRGLRRQGTLNIWGTACAERQNPAFFVHQHLSRKNSYLTYHFF